MIATLPNGRLYLIGQPSGFPLVVKCATCRRPSRFTAADFNALPLLTAAQLEALNVLGELSRDWLGSGLAKEHARDLVAAGLMGPGAVRGRKPDGA